MNIKNLFTKLSIGVLFATTVTIAANPAQAASFTPDTRVNFDEVTVGLEDEDNPLYGGQKINNLWADDFGLKMNSSVNELWLYNSNCKGNEEGTSNNGFTNTCTGGDPDLATGYGEYDHNGKIKYNTAAQGNVLIIQEHNNNKLNNLDKRIKELEEKERNKNISDSEKNELDRKKRRFNNQSNQIKENIDDYDLRPDDNIGGTIEFKFTKTNGVLFDSLGLLDLDENDLPQFRVKFAGQNQLSDWFLFKENDEDNPPITTPGDQENTEILTHNDSGYITQMTRQRGSKNGNLTDENSLREYKFDFGNRITEFHVQLAGSGAVTELNYHQGNKNYAIAKVPEPTSILGLAAVSALAASSLKRKRKSSNIELS